MVKSARAAARAARKSRIDEKRGTLRKVDGKSESESGKSVSLAPQYAHPLTALPTRIRVLREPFSLEGEARQEETVQLGKGYLKGWTFIGRRIAGIEIENREQPPARPQRPVHRRDIVRPSSWIDRAETCVLPNPIKRLAQMLRQRKQIRQFVALALDRKSVV